MKDIDLIRDKVSQIKKPNFIDSTEIELNSGDEGNGEAAIDFFYIGTKYSFFRISDDYKLGYNNNDETKLVHCFCNQLFFDWNHEIEFYVNGIFLRGAKSVEVKMNDKEIYKW